MIIRTLQVYLPMSLSFIHLFAPVLYRQDDTQCHIDEPAQIITQKTKLYGVKTKLLHHGTYMKEDRKRKYHIPNP
jgi:hypothetical protein